MIRNPHRAKGGAQLGAQAHGEPGPFGRYADGDGPDEILEDPAEHGQVLAAPAGPEVR